MSDIARTVSSIGVSGSARWQKIRSTKSSPSRSSEPSIAWMQVLAIEGEAHVHLVADAPVELRREHVALSVPAELADRLAEDRLGFAVGVGLGGVEVVHPALACQVEALLCERGVDLRTEGHPRAEREHAHLQAGPSESAVLHRSLPSAERRASTDAVVPRLRPGRLSMRRRPPSGAIDGARSIWRAKPNQR